MSNVNQHIKAQIHDYLDGELSAEKTDELWAHLLGNNENYEYLETLATLRKMGAEGQFDSVSTVEETAKPYVATETTTIFHLKRYLAAASVLLVGVTIVFNVMTSQDITATLSPLPVIEYDIERSADNATRFKQDINSVIELSAGGEIEEAIIVLDRINETLDLSDSQKAELSILKGSVYYNSGDYDSAKQVFEHFVQTTDLSADFLNYEKGVWYLANSYLQLGDFNLAKAYIEKVIQLDGAYKRVAESQLSQLD